MKLDIVHQLPGGRQWFSAGDTVRGCVVLDTPRNEQILSVVVTLHGRTKVSCVRSQDDYNPPPYSGTSTIHAEHQIFRTSKPLLSNIDSPSGERFAPGVHFLPFTIAFESIARHASHEQMRKVVGADMPPSLYIRSQNIKGDVAYFLSARLQRQGLFRLNMSKRKELLFRLANPSLLSLPGNFSGTIKSVALPAESFQTYQRIATPYESLSPYTPSIRLQLAMPTQVLQPDRPLSLELTTFISRELLRQLGTITLRSLLFRLQTAVTADIDGLSKSCRSSRNICYLSGSIPLVPPPEEEACQLDPGLWQNYLVPAVLPSFASQGISRTHILEITAGFTSKDHQNTQYACLTVDVALLGDPQSQDPPPTYCPL